MKLKTAILSSAAVAAMAIGTSAKAGDYYLSVFMGMGTNDDSISGVLSGGYKTKSTTYSLTGGGKYYVYSATNTHYTTLTFGTNSPTEYDNGWVVGVAVGRDIGHNLRAELELAYRQFDADIPAAVDVSIDYRFADYDHDQVLPYYSKTGSFTAELPQSGTGDSSAWSYMINTWYDFDVGHERLTPFIGGGLGAANVFLDYDAKVAGTVYTPNSKPVYVDISTNIRDSGWVFAYQFGGGLGYDFDNGMVLTAQYRYFGTTEAELDGINQRVGGHNILIGLSIPLDLGGR